MSILNKIKAQLDPFDGGETFNNPNPNQGIRGMLRDIGGAGRMDPNNTVIGRARQSLRELPRAQAIPRRPMEGYMSPDNVITNGMVNSGALPQSQREIYPQNPSTIARWPMVQSPEDASYMMGQQGPVPIDADIANFRIQPQGMPEDAGLVRGPQGYAPLNNDVGHLRRAQSYIRQLYR